jgi:hypothetical protein
MIKSTILAVALSLVVPAANAEIFVTLVNNDSSSFILDDVDTQVTQYNGGPATIVGARSSSVFSATSLLPNVEVVDVTYRSSVSSRDECNFRYVTINGFPQSPITNRRGSARCSARVTGFDFGTGDSLVRFTMDR